MTTDQRRELGAAPGALCALLEAELAAGDTIVEVRHCFPAPPARALFRLATKVTFEACRNAGIAVSRLLASGPCLNPLAHDPRATSPTGPHRAD